MRARHIHTHTGSSAKARANIAPIASASSVVATRAGGRRAVTAGAEGEALGSSAIDVMLGSPLPRARTPLPSKPGPRNREVGSHP